MKLNVSDAAKDMPTIRNLPRKKKKSRENQNEELQQSRCSICNVVFGSPEDVLLDKRFKKNNKYMGCEVDNCNYWVHVRCGGHTISKEDEIIKIQFKCPDHDDDQYCSSKRSKRH